jgi:hypothetical protein
VDQQALEKVIAMNEPWKPIETAKKGPGYVVVGWNDGKWIFKMAWWDDQQERWTDASSDRFLSPTVWAPLPENELR